MRVVRWKAAVTALFVSVAAACLLSAPSAALAADGRTDDVARAATDRQLREELYRNYGIA